MMASARIVQTCLFILPNLHHRASALLPHSRGLPLTRAFSRDAATVDFALASVRSSYTLKEKSTLPTAAVSRQILEIPSELRAGATYCVTRYRQANCNLRTQAHRIIRTAGLKPWPRTFQNLRASPETELTESFPVHTVVAWLGSIQPVAMKHFLQVTEEYFAHAAQLEAGTGQHRAETKPRRSRRKSGSTAMYRGLRDPANPPNSPKGTRTFPTGAIENTDFSRGRRKIRRTKRRKCPSGLRLEAGCRTLADTAGAYQGGGPGAGQNERRSWRC